MANAEKHTILCVDDNLAMAENLSEVLADSGYDVNVANTCAEALVRAQSGFDVALVDVRLPDGEGIQLATKLRNLIPEGQVILMTGFASVESAASAVRSGAWAYLIKPCPTNHLLLTIEQALRQVDLLKEKAELVRRAQVTEKLAAIGTLTAGLSHEIKNPLNAASLQLAVLENRLRKLPAEMSANLAEPLKLVQSEIVRLTHILEEFLQFARPREAQLEEVDMAALLAGIVDFLTAEADKAEVTLERDWQNLPKIFADAGQLQQALMNLLLNAIQATPPRGVVRVSALLRGPQLEISISDTGPGVPEAIRPRIFEPFFTTKDSGSGLGLPLVHSVVEQHNGTITVDENWQGGARFVVQLPVKNSHRAPRHL